MDMRFKLLLDREQQGQFKIYWRPGKTNLANYFMKHHPPAHHCNVQELFLTRVAELQRLCQEQATGKEASLAMTDGSPTIKNFFIARNRRATLEKTKLCFRSVLQGCINISVMYPDTI